jgi:hypothetical protein
MKQLDVRWSSITHLVPKHSSMQGASARLTQARCEVLSITHLYQVKK